MQVRCTYIISETMYKILIRINEYDGKKRVPIRGKKRPVVCRIALQDVGLTGLAMQGYSS